MTADPRATRHLQWRQALPRSTPVDRERLLVELSAGKRVFHIGFVDYPLLAERIAAGDWLHARLAASSGSLVGIDSSRDGVEWAIRAGYEAYVADASSPEDLRALALDPADVVVAGEIVEHLDAPGPFLRAMRELTKPDGVLILTTPNAYRILNFVVPLAWFACIHPDHTAWHSPHTLRNLVERNGWRVEALG